MFAALCRSAVPLLVGMALLHDVGNHVRADDDLVGREVLTIRRDVLIMSGSRTIYRCDVGELLNVVGVERDRLNVGIGFVAGDGALPIEEAMRRFTRQIETNPSAEHYYQRARGHFATRETTQALLDISECLSKDHRHARALVLQGQCWHRTGRFAQALESLNEAVEADKDLATAYLERGKVHLSLDADDKAKTDFDKALRLRRDLYATYFVRGVALVNLGEFAAASGDLSDYLLVMRNDVDAYQARAWCHMALQQFDHAAADLAACIRLEPQQSKHYVERAKILLADNKPIQATADLRQAIKLNGDVGQTHFYLGAALIKCGKHEEALKELDEALELDANLVDARSVRALYWLNQREFAKALAELNAAIGIEPEDYASLQLRAWLFATASDDEIRNGRQALKDAKMACELTKYERVEAIKSLAAAYAEIGDFDEAVRRQKKAIELNQDEDDKEELAETLRLFEQKKPLRLE